MYKVRGKGKVPHRRGALLWGAQEGMIIEGVLTRKINLERLQAFPSL